MKKFFKTIGLIILALVIAFAGFLIYALMNDYKPAEEEYVFQNMTTTLLPDSIEFSLMIWNIGYGGLNREMDFFYDGGEKVRPEEDVVKKNVKGILSLLKTKSSVDFILLQEVDVHSKRSYYTNEYQMIKEMFQGRNSTYGKNYDVFFVPLPVSNPMGKVESGLMTISRFAPLSSMRYSFPGNYAFPTGLFMLDRCFLVNRYNMDNGRQLLVINTHNSAYDDGSLRLEQMKFLKDFLLEEYQKGNYIVVGGDWNQSPPGFKPGFVKDVMDNENRTDIPFDYLPDWRWVYSNEIPTNRRVTTPYKQGLSLTTVIDFYLISPNIQALSVNNLDVGFEFSDHQPVELKVKLLAPNHQWEF